MAAMKSILDPTRSALVVQRRHRNTFVSFLAQVVNRAGADSDTEAEGGLSVSELLGRANRNLNPIQDGFQLRGDIAVPNHRNADPCTQTGCMWPKACDGNVYIPYLIDSVYNTLQVSIITSGLNSFSNSTCIRFIPYTNQTDYVYIHPLEGCYSFVGRTGGEQSVSLSFLGCVDFGVTQHELLHVLGFDHEHCRSDRDQHVQILLQNVISGEESNFYKINTLNLGTPYDYNSVMHYNRLAFSKDFVNPTIVAIPNPNTVFGTATQMSQNDINRINLLYCSK
ncbi:high choriolytic enzyme 1-like [Betta splendens]|uniref:Metalloendopeptidase n=1 Tax=Betta splendens TaxID=158456 RepID=A0A8M1HF80_BETSP|nr:high choriolytic enzyme 1-like [Betta splendens]